MNKYLLYLIFPTILLLYWQYRYFENRHISFVDSNKPCQEFTIGFYNLENMFDTIDDPKVIDEEFLPGSANQWNTERYQQKLNHISEAVISLNNHTGVDLLGVSEVENRGVLEDLLKTGNLKNSNYEIVHYDSPDARGIDVALLYNKKKFKLLASKPIKVSYDELGFATRDILWATLLIGKDTLNVFVNHWPSRRGGTELSDPKRVAAATILNTYLKNLFANSNAHVVIVGDFNDEPNNKSVSEILAPYDKPQENCSTCLVNPMIDLKKKGLGTHYFRGHYETFDQIIFTSNLSLPAFWHSDYNAVRIFKEDFIMKTDSVKNIKQPSRTFEGPHYNGGYSDHLPVYATLCIGH